MKRLEVQPQVEVVRVVGAIVDQWLVAGEVVGLKESQVAASPFCRALAFALSLGADH